jgi:hypothetical protein
VPARYDSSGSIRLGLSKGPFQSNPQPQGPSDTNDFLIKDYPSPCTDSNPDSEDLMERLRFLKNNILQKDISFKEKMDVTTKIDRIQSQIGQKGKNYIEKESILD